MDDLGLVSFCKTTGGKGLHVVTPLAVNARKPLSWDAAKDFARAVCAAIADEEPDRYLIKMTTESLRKGASSSTICATIAWRPPSRRSRRAGTAGRDGLHAAHLDAGEGRSRSEALHDPYRSGPSRKGRRHGRTTASRAPVATGDQTPHQNKTVRLMDMHEDMTDALTALDQFRACRPSSRESLWPLAGSGTCDRAPARRVLENLGWFGKRFTADLKADPLLFRSGERRLTAVDPAYVPLRLALRFHRFGQTQAASNLFSYLHGRLCARGPAATLRSLPFEGLTSAAMVYDRQPITDHFRRIDENRLMGVMVIQGDPRRYVFTLERVTEPGAVQP